MPLSIGGPLEPSVGRYRPNPALLFIMNDVAKIVSRPVMLVLGLRLGLYSVGRFLGVWHSSLSVVINNNNTGLSISS